MKVLILKANNTISTSRILSGKDDEISSKDVKKFLSNEITTVVAAKISRLARIYVMFVEKEASKRPVNNFASAIASIETGIVRGDAIIARTNHLGHGAKTYVMDDDEIQEVLALISKLTKTKLGVAADARR